MAQSADISAILEDVVRQFADPFAFWRELIQNSIDAGTSEVVVNIDYDHDEQRLTASIQDFGEGMTREIIETQLTRLFSSAKDADYTKIGKFGIGFVSVFAVAPELVVVDTGSSGEYWRVIFHPDRTFDLVALGHPVEGTQVRIYKSAAAEEADEFRERTKRVIRQWCRHVEVPIYVDGEDVRDPFEVDGVVAVAHGEKGTRIVASLIADPPATAGYFNRGLLLQETESPWRHASFKIDSRYLEHTLTRDRVLEDKNFHKAFSLIREAVEELLPAEWRREVFAAADGSDFERLDELIGILGHSNDEAAELAKSIESDEVLPCVDGSFVSLDDVRDVDGGVVLAGSQTPMTDAFRSPVLRAGPGSRLRSALMRLIDCRIAEHHVFVVHAEADLEGAGPLLEHFAGLVRHLGGDGVDVRWGDFVHGDSVWAKHPVVALPERDRPIPTPDMPPVSSRAFVTQPEVVVNAAADDVHGLCRVATREPEWAALTLFRLAALEDGIDPEHEHAMVTWAVARREARTGGAS